MSIQRLPPCDPRRLWTRAAPAVLLLLAVVTLGNARLRAAAPAGRYTFQGTSPDETVTDTQTGLVWQRAVSSSTYSWSEAQDYCANLDLLHTGWRVPSIKELQTIVDETRFGPAIDTDAFPDAPNAHFWTSSLTAGATPDVSWVLNSISGETTFVANTNNSGPTMLRVWCVRDADSTDDEPPDSGSTSGSGEPTGSGSTDGEPTGSGSTSGSGEPTGSGSTDGEPTGSGSAALSISGEYDLGGSPTLLRTVLNGGTAAGNVRFTRDRRELDSAEITEALTGTSVDSEASVLEPTNKDSAVDPDSEMRRSD